MANTIEIVFAFYIKAFNLLIQYNLALNLTTTIFIFASINTQNTLGELLICAKLIYIVSKYSKKSNHTHLFYKKFNNIVSIFSFF